MDAMSSHQIFSLTPSAGEVVGRVCVGECDEDTEKLSLFATAGLRTRHLAYRTYIRATGSVCLQLDFRST